MARETSPTWAEVGLQRDRLLGLVKGVQERLEMMLRVYSIPATLPNDPCVAAMRGAVEDVLSYTNTVSRITNPQPLKGTRP